MIDTPYDGERSLAVTNLKIIGLSEVSTVMLMLLRFTVFINISFFLIKFLGEIKFGALKKSLFY